MKKLIGFITVLVSMILVLSGCEKKQTKYLTADLIGMWVWTQCNASPFQSKEISVVEFNQDALLLLVD